VKLRLDQLLVRRGLVESRERAQALIMAGQVDLDGRAAVKPGTMVSEHAAVTVTGPDHPWVSRGGVKLAHALDVFGIDVAGRTAIDIGASTGGFTDVLLHRGAARVIAVDVGHGQLHWKLRNDPRVVVVEGCNARRLTRDVLPDPAAGADVATIDVSFISLGLILPAVAEVVAPGADVVALVKPQFEAGRRDAPKGVVRDPAVHARVQAAVTAMAAGIGWTRLGVTPSPIVGAKGNREFLMHFRLDPQRQSSTRPPAPPPGRP
jgi:23S rRNA (cytidine1920-2'-O)/16S rRNA (cytidine1409-2'-O)-methyltransferase